MTARRTYHRLRDLLDVLVASPADGEVLTYSSGAGKWENQAGGGGSQTWLGPIAFDFTQAEIATGFWNGYGIINLPDVVLAAGTLWLRTVVVISTSFDNMTTGFVLSINDETDGQASTPFSAVAGTDSSGRVIRGQAALKVAETGSDGTANGAIGLDVGLIEMDGLSAVLAWTPDGDVLPSQGAGQLWIEAVPA